MKKFFLVSALVAMGWSSVSFSADVPPESVWRYGLKTLVGRSFVFNHVSSLGGFWEAVYQKVKTPSGEDAEQRVLRKQTSLDDLPESIRKMIQSAEIKIDSLEKNKIELSDRAPSPGQRGQPPYSNVMLFYRETGEGNLTVRNLPGVGLEGDKPDYQGKVSFTLSHASSTDPSDSGLTKQREGSEISWGISTLISMYAQLSAAPVSDQEEDEFNVLENLRLLRGGEEMIAWVEYEYTETTSAGQKLRHTYQGSLNLRAR